MSPIIFDFFLIVFSLSKYVINPVVFSYHALGFLVDFVVNSLFVSFSLCWYSFVYTLEVLYGTFKGLISSVYSGYFNFYMKVIGNNHYRAISSIFTIDYWWYDRSKEHSIFVGTHLIDEVLSLPLRFMKGVCAVIEAITGYDITPFAVTCQWHALNTLHAFIELTFFNLIDNASKADYMRVFYGAVFEPIGPTTFDYRIKINDYTALDDVVGGATEIVEELTGSIEEGCSVLTTEWIKDPFKTYSNGYKEHDRYVNDAAEVISDKPSIKDEDFSIFMATLILLGALTSAILIEKFFD